MTNNLTFEQERVSLALLARLAGRVAAGSLFIAALFLSSVDAQVSGPRTDPTLPKSEVESKSEPSYRLSKGMNEFGAWMAGSFNSATPIGNTAYRPTLRLGLRYARIVGTTRWATFAYVMDLVPVEVVFNQESAQVAGQPPHRSNVYGLGGNYGGLKISFLRRARVKPFAGFSAGLIYYSRPVPLNGRRLNFTYELSGGVDIFLKPKRALTLSYQFYHVSNLFTAPANIGTNDNLIRIGFSCFK